MDLLLTEIHTSSYCFIVYRMIEDASNAFERGEFGAIIPGSCFQINALVSSTEGTKKKKKKKNSIKKK
jgi:hypothetical protein